MLIVRSLRGRIVFFMSIISEERYLFAEELQTVLSPTVLQELAKQVGFVQRLSKYQANELLALCTWLSHEVASTSLTCVTTGVLMSPEGLIKRFNKTAITFLQVVFTSLLTQKLCSSQSLSPQTMSLFKRIRILDATFFQLPDVYSSEYPRSGGSSNNAGVKIQFEYDVLSGEFLHIQVGPGNRNDKTYGKTYLKTMESGDLCLRDLDYFDLKEVYYISLLKLNTRVYIKNPTPEYFKNDLSTAQYSRNTAPIKIR